MPKYKFTLDPAHAAIGWKWATYEPTEDPKRGSAAGPESPAPDGDFEFWAAFFALIFHTTAGCPGCNTKLRTAVRKFCADRRAVRMPEAPNP